MRKFTLALSLAAMLPVIANAQRYLGVATSNWSGTNGVYLNPANLADSRHKFTVDLFSLNMGLDNNLGTINFSKFTTAIGGGDSSKFSNAFTITNTGKFSMLLPYAEVRGPGFMVSLGKNHGIALTTRVRAINQFNDISQSLYQTLTVKNFNPTANGTTSVQAGAFNWTMHAWSEIGLSYGGVIWNKKKHMVKGGLSARYLMGAGYVSINSKNMDVAYSYQNNMASLKMTNTDLNYAQGGVDISGGAGDFSSNIGKNAGKGYGFDLGVVYEYRPKYKSYKYDMDGKTGISDLSKNQYMLRFSAAVTDIGSIKYSGNNFQASFTGNGTVTSQNMADSLGSFSEFKSYMGSKGFKAGADSTSSTKVGLPTSLVIGVDYHAYRGFYVNLLYMGNLADRTKVGNSIYSQITLTPRFDVRGFSVGVPVTYSMLTKSVKAGLGIRLGGFVFGSDDIAGVFSSNARGVNFYMGLSVPFSKKKPRDSDGDMVSNRKDKCKNEKGVWEMRGCPNPDKDGDGVLDKDDKCPDVAGSKTAAGCPDSDLDGVADAEDRCPTESGDAAMQGCPDRDKDGIADIDDACPDQAGLAQFKGCPDTDGDGIADNVDKCPTAAGPAANEGCPDTDNDGVADHMDKCPTVAGTVNNAGCPEVSVQVKKRLAFAATAIQFDPGKATIKKASNKMLDEIVKILNDYPDYNMSIEGHTDNVGKPEKNMTLSTDRAAAVKGYFISKGISADRLSSAGYGDTKPVASNKTAAGRAKNRRVAMDLKLKD
jgi:outer membrane protein OmpA-like peptidoglycan-associated protein